MKRVVVAVLDWLGVGVICYGLSLIYWPLAVLGVGAWCLLLAWDLHGTKGGEP